MKQFLIKLSLFFALFFIVDKAFILLRNSSPEREVDKRLEAVLLGEMNQDIVVLGSSKSARGILAGEIEKITGKSTYNLSYPGGDICFQEFILATLLEKNEKPETIILSIDEIVQFADQVSLNFRMDRMYPLVKYPEIREELFRLGEKNELLSNLFILHQLSIYNFDLRQKHFSKLDSISSNGSMPISFQKQTLDWDLKDDLNPYKIENEVEGKLQCFLDLQNSCLANDIELIIVFIPTFKKFNELFYQRFLELVDPKVRFFRYEAADNPFENKNYYHDLTHLNQKGAKLYTELLTEEVLLE